MKYLLLVSFFLPLICRITAAISETAISELDTLSQYSVDGSFEESEESRKVAEYPKGGIATRNIDDGVAKFAESDAYENEGPIQMERFRDLVGANQQTLSTTKAEGTNSSDNFSHSTIENYNEKYDQKSNDSDVLAVTKEFIGENIVYETQTTQQFNRYEPDKISVNEVPKKEESKKENRGHRKDNETISDARFKDLVRAWDPNSNPIEDSQPRLQNQSSQILFLPHEMKRSDRNDTIDEIKLGELKHSEFAVRVVPEFHSPGSRKTESFVDFPLYNNTIFVPDIINQSSDKPVVNLNLEPSLSQEHIINNIVYKMPNVSSFDSPVMKQPSPDIKDAVTNPPHSVIKSKPFLDVVNRTNLYSLPIPQEQPYQAPMRNYVPHVYEAQHPKGNLIAMYECYECDDCIVDKYTATCMSSRGCLQIHMRSSYGIPEKEKIVLTCIETRLDVGRGPDFPALELCEYWIKTSLAKECKTCYHNFCNGQEIAGPRSGQRYSGTRIWKCNYHLLLLIIILALYQ